MILGKEMVRRWQDGSRCWQSGGAVNHSSVYERCSAYEHSISCLTRICLTNES